MVDKDERIEYKDDMKRHIELLKTVAEDIEPFAGARIAAMVLYKNRIISFGVNQDKTHPFQAKYAKNDEAVYWHAETNAIHNALKKVTPDELKKCTLVVCRIKHSGPDQKYAYGLAKPCEGCEKCIKDHGLKRVVYTQHSALDEIEYAVRQKG